MWLPRWNYRGDRALLGHWIEHMDWVTGWPADR
jgi:hypothetical protein